MLWQPDLPFDGSRFATKVSATADSLCLKFDLSVTARALEFASTPNEHYRDNPLTPAGRKIKADIAGLSVLELREQKGQIREGDDDRILIDSNPYACSIIDETTVRAQKG